MLHKIKILQAEGLSKRAIAVQLNIHRKTVDKYMKMSEDEICLSKNHQDRVKGLDTYRPFIIMHLRKHPKISAPKMIAKLSDHITGYKCSARSMRRYLALLKKTVVTQKRRYYEPVIDMVPGIQAQIDAGELRGVMIAGMPTTVYFVVFVLSYSRAMYVSVTLRPINTDMFIMMHDCAFRYFGGVPHECVYDQTKLVVIDEIAREITVNQRFNEYVLRAGFEINACNGYDPESKGKVEAGVKYVKNNCFYAEEFASESIMQEHVADWLKKANQRIHGTTGKIPDEVLKHEERSRLKPYLIPEHWRASKPILTRKSDKTSLISWQGNKYSIPDDYQDTHVGVEQSGSYLYVYELEGNTEIAIIELSELKGEIFKNPTHYRRYRLCDQQYEDELHELIGDTASEICVLLKKSSPKIYRAQLKGFIALVRRYGSLTHTELSTLTKLDRLTVRTAVSFIDGSREPSNDCAPQKLDQYAQLTKGDAHD